MVSKIKHIIEPGLIPFTLAFAFSLFVVLYKLLGLPSPQELLLITRKLYVNHGGIIIIAAAFIEGFFMISLYFPGSFIILVAVLASDMKLVSLVKIGIFSWLGFMLSGIVNYIMGRYGYYQALLFLGKKDTVEKMKKWMNQYGQWATFLASFHPNYLAISLVCSGISRSRFWYTLIVAGLSLIFWIFLWMLVGTPLLRKVNIEDPNQSLYIVLALIGWGVILIIIENIKKINKVKN